MRPNFFVARCFQIPSDVTTACVAPKPMRHAGFGERLKASAMIS
jgi:hypothetical protein